MGNNMSPYTFAIGRKCTYFISVHHKFIENDKIEVGTFLNTTNNSLDAFDNHLEKCGVDSFKVLDQSQTQTLYPHYEKEIEDEDEDDVLVEEDEYLNETNYRNGTNEVVKTFNQKCVICCERDSEYAFRECGLQCIYEHCYQSIVIMIYQNVLFVEHNKNLQ